MKQSSLLCVTCYCASFVLSRLDQKVYSGDYEVGGYHPLPTDDIQADLEKYLVQHSVQALLTTLVERLILSESNNPYATIIENLCRDYPEQALKGLELSSPKKSP